MNYSFLQKTVILSLIVTSFFACGNLENSTVDVLKNPPLTIEQYLSDNNIQNAIETREGIYVQIEKEGSIEKPRVSNKVTIHYKGYLLDNTVFDQTEGEARTYPLGALIAGWQIGIPYIGKGGKCKLIIPPHLGYGSNDVGPIPGNSILVFDIELEDFN